MITRLNGLTRHTAKSLAPVLMLLGFAPILTAQQYCASGAITSVLNCNSCNFHVGDPVAMTFTVTPSSVKCTGTLQCLANSVFSANIGGRYWTEQDSATYGNLDDVGSSFIYLNGSGFLSPSPAGAPADSNLSVSLEVTGSNLLASGALPAALPSPAAVAAAHSILTFSATTEGGGSPSFSYTGQNCAVVPSTPTITTGGIVPVYSSATTIQPGEWVSIYGANLASGAFTWTGNFPVSLGGTGVTIDGKSAYLWVVSPTQINLQVPDDTRTGTVPVVVTTASGSVTSNVTLGPFAPSFLLLDAKHVTGIILRSNGSGAYGGGAYDIIGPTGSSLGYPTVAAKAGDTIELFGVGFGPTSPSVPAGQVFSGSASTTNTVKVVVNKVSVIPSFAGLSGAGLYQINLTLPVGLGTGDVPLVASVSGAQTPSNVVISLQ